MLNLDGIPDELKALPNWAVARPDGSPRIPGSDKLASYKRPADMKAFEAVIADLRPGEYPCFSSYGTAYLVLDRDGCFLSNEPPTIELITEIAMLDTYIEYSKSRTGITRSS